MQKKYSLIVALLLTTVVINASFVFADTPDGSIVFAGAGTVPGSGWIGPLSYNVTGAHLGAVSVETNTLHRYDNGKFSGPTIIEIRGTATNNAHELADSIEYSYGEMGFYGWIKYEDVNGSIITAADTRDPETLEMTAFGPGVYEYRITAIIPETVKQVEGRSTVMIQIESIASWSTSTRRTFAANLQFINYSGLEDVAVPDDDAEETPTVPDFENPEAEIETETTDDPTPSILESLPVLPIVIVVVVVVAAASVAVLLMKRNSISKLPPPPP